MTNLAWYPCIEYKFIWKDLKMSNMSDKERTILMDNATQKLYY